MHTPAQASVDPTIGNTEFLTPWKHPQRSTEHDTGQAAPIASEHSSSLGSSLAAPAIHEPPPSLALHRPKNVRKAKSFHSLATHKNQKASQSSPELPRSRVASQENIPLPPQQQHRERKVSGLGLNLSWVGLGRPSTDNSTTSSRSSSDSRPSLSSRKSFSFLRGSSGPKATTAPVRPQVSGKHLSPSNFTASEKRSASPEPPLPPSLPAVNVDPTFDWDLSHRKSSSRDAMTNKPGSFFLTRSRSSSMGKLLRDAVTSSSTVSPGSTSPASQTRAASPASQNEDPVMSRSGSRSNAPRLSRLPTPTLDSAPHSPASIPSSPLVHSSDQMSHTEPNIQYKDRALTFALPHASEPHDAPQAIPRPQSSSGTSDGTRQSRRSSVASAFQAINPFHHHGHNSSRPCLFSDTEGRVLDSPSEEPDLASLLSHSVTDSVTLKERDLAGAIPQEDRKRSGSLASSSGGGWRSTVFGRRRASSLALNNQATETLHIPTAEDSTRPSISSVTSFSSNRSDPYNTSPNRWAASASTSTLPSASSSRKPSMIFSKAPTRSSFSSHPSPTLPQQSTPPKDEKPPKIEEDDTPESYLERLEENCAKAQIAKLLSSSSEPFYAEALRLYMGRFTFKDIAIDIALRKLLMELFLPRETQQIDRVMETFATHYQAQNPDVFTSTDQCYILAFSLIMLHTDAFNTHNKNKMTKEDYVRNTRQDGLPVELLEYCFDNTVHAPYMFVDGSTDLTAPHQANSLGSTLSSSLTSSKEKAKMEVYQLIMTGQTRRLRVGVQYRIPFKNPYSWTGTVPFFDASSLQDAFINSNEVIIPTSESKSKSTDALAAAAISPLEGGLGGLQMASLNHSSPVVRYAKAGLLLRKDDRVEGGKKASSRKWREWSVVLTASQLLFFKDPTIVEELATSGSIDSRGRRTTRLPPGRTFKPDSVLPLKGFVAVYDFSFVKRSNTFALVAESKQQLLFQAPDDSELNEWLGLINWAASFQNTGVKLRTQPTVEASGTRRPHASKGSTKSQSSDEAASQHRRMIFSAQGQVVGSAPGGDCAWDDDHVFEQFVQSDLSHLPAGRASRTDIVRNTIAGLDKDIASDKSILQGDLCRAKLLDMLHPFSNSTRNRLTALVSPLAKRIKHMRLDICRRSVAREVLARDLLSEERDLTRLMASASRPRLQSATSELSVSRHELHATQISRRHTDSPFPSSAEASSDVTSSVAPSEPTQQLGMKI